MTQRPMMKSPAPTAAANLPLRQTLLGVLILGGAVAVATVLALVRGESRPGWPQAVAFAAAVSGVSAVGGWLIARKPSKNPSLAVAGALASSALRIFVPLGALAWLQGPGPPLREAGADGLLVLFYLLLLAIALGLHIMWGSIRPKCSDLPAPD